MKKPVLVITFVIVLSYFNIVFSFQRVIYTPYDNGYKTFNLVYKPPVVYNHKNIPSAYNTASSYILNGRNIFYDTYGIRNNIKNFYSSNFGLKSGKAASPGYGAAQMYGYPAIPGNLYGYNFKSSNMYGYNFKSSNMYGYNAVSGNGYGSYVPVASPNNGIYGNSIYKIYGNSGKDIYENSVKDVYGNLIRRFPYSGLTGHMLSNLKGYGQNGDIMHNQNAGIQSKVVHGSQNVSPPPEFVNRLPTGSKLSTNKPDVRLPSSVDVSDSHIQSGMPHNANEQEKNNNSVLYEKMRVGDNATRNKTEKFSKPSNKTIFKSDPEVISKVEANSNITKTFAITTEQIGSITEPEATSITTETESTTDVIVEKISSPTPLMDEMDITDAVQTAETTIETISKTEGTEESLTTPRAQTVSSTEVSIPKLSRRKMRPKLRNRTIVFK